MSTDSETPIDEYKVAEALDALRDNVIGCTTCQPWDEGEVVWLGPHTDIDDLLVWGEGLEENAVDEALKQFRCPGCGVRLDREDEVLVKSEYDREVESHLEKSADKALVSKLNAFSEFLAQYPYLGADDPAGTGREIIDAIKNSTAATIGSQVLYRARLLDKESRLYRLDEMGAPNPSKVYVHEGRYNHTGQAFLYLAVYEDTAFAEVSSDKADICVIQKYELKDVGKILNLKADYADVDTKLTVLQAAIVYNGFVGKKPEGTSSWKPEYFVPRFLSDVARLCGYSGVLFSSAVSIGDNLVLFDPNHPNCKAVGEPYIYHKKKTDPPAMVGLVKGFGVAGG